MDKLNKIKEPKEENKDESELMRWLERGNYDGRYQVQIEFTRLVRVPALGPEVYTRDSIYGCWGYGKQKEYSSSKKAVEALTDMAQPFLGLCSSCCITVYNGGCGEIIYLKNEQTMFSLKFNGESVLP